VSVVDIREVTRNTRVSLVWNQFSGSLEELFGYCRLPC